jgi:hypothetical protein
LSRRGSMRKPAIGKSCSAPCCGTENVGPAFRDHPDIVGFAGRSPGAGK